MASVAGLISFLQNINDQMWDLTCLPPTYALTDHLYTFVSHYTPHTPTHTHTPINSWENILVLYTLLQSPS